MATVEEWNARYAASVAQILSCSRNPTKADCNVQTIPPPFVATEPERHHEEIETCTDQGYRLRFDPDVPYESAAFLDDGCYCGVREGTSAAAARSAGWLAEADGEGGCVCRFEPGAGGDNTCPAPR